MSWECPEYPKKTALVLRSMSWKQCRTSGASGECAQLNGMLIVRSIWNKYTTCNRYPGSVQNICKTQPWCSGKCPGKMRNVRSIIETWTNKSGSWRSEMSEINVIHVLEMCGMSAKSNPDARVNVLGKCRTSRASEILGHQYQLNVQKNIGGWVSEITMPPACTNVIRIAGICGKLNLWNSFSIAMYMPWVNMKSPNHQG